MQLREWWLKVINLVKQHKKRAWLCELNTAWQVYDWLIFILQLGSDGFFEGRQSVSQLVWHPVLFPLSTFMPVVSTSWRTGSYNTAAYCLEQKEKKNIIYTFSSFLFPLEAMRKKGFSASPTDNFFLNQQRQRYRILVNLQSTHTGT